MDASFTPIEVVPSKTPFGLDQLRRSYRTSLSAEDAIAAAPAVGTADETFEFMFLMPITTPESAESATRVDLVYMGCLQDDGVGNPVLPSQKRDTENAVQSASSSRGTDGAVASSPVTVQFYCPTNTLTYFSFEAPGTDVADDPTDELTVISITVGDTSITPGSIAGLVEIFFQQQILETHQSTEIVPGKYWQNTSRKIKSYVAFILELVPGFYVNLSAPGINYSVGNSLTISDGGESATVDIDTLGIANGVATYTVTSNTFTHTANFIAATGGSGSGAQFNVFEVT